MYRNEIRCIVLRKKCHAERKDVTIKKRESKDEKMFNKKTERKKEMSGQE
jgi:hypothetical protein